MEVFNKLYSSVTQTVSQLSSVLLGNPVTREYDVTRHIASAGRGCMWKIYSGVKRSTRQEASIFVLEKKLFDRFSKDDRDEIFDVIRRGVIQLTKIRHPQVLTVQHPLEESRESFAFAGEPVYASLANILGDHTNVPQPVVSELAAYSLYETEIKYGLLQLFESIQFIHNDAKLVHRNISPHSLVINCHGVWKIFGFDYCVNNQIALRYDFNPNQNILAIPSLEYTAPECVLDNSYSSRADYYSLGVLICAIYAKNCYPFKKIGQDYMAFKKAATELRSAKHLNLCSLPQELHNFVRMLLTASPEKRPDFIQLSKITYFDDIGVKSLGYLDTLFQRDNQEKAKFYKGLPQIIKRLPARISLHRILPCLQREFVHPTMIPFVLPNVFIIAEMCTQNEFEKYVFVYLKPIMSMQEPIQILLIFMQNMELLLKLTPPNDMKLHVLPMVYKALESNSVQIQELCLTVLPSFASLLDYTSMKKSLLPRIKSLCANSTNTSVRVNCLLCIGQLLPHLDKWMVLDDILLFLPTITFREPAVIMAIIGIYKIASNHEALGIPKEFAANKVLPFLWPLSIENNLTLNQYNTIMAVLHSIAEKVETEHVRKLGQLNTEDNNSLPLEILPLSGKSSFASESDAAKIPRENAIHNEFRPLTSLKSGSASSLIPASAPAKSQPVMSTRQSSFQSSVQQPPGWCQLRPSVNLQDANFNGNHTSTQSESVFSNMHTIPLLQPASASRNNTNMQTNPILSKEEILEFLK